MAKKCLKQTKQLTEGDFSEIYRTELEKCLCYNLYLLIVFHHVDACTLACACVKYEYKNQGTRLIPLHILVACNVFFIHTFYFNLSYNFKISIARLKIDSEK